MQVTPECICEVKKDYLLYTHFCPLCGKPSPLMKKHGYVYDCEKKNTIFVAGFHLMNLKKLKQLVN
jgi:hypothetical protein